MLVSVAKIKGSNDEIIGAVISTILESSLRPHEKLSIESKLQMYVLSDLFPGRSVSLYREYYNDQATIVAMLDVDSLETEFFNVPR